jgi:hypothetical protein
MENLLQTKKQTAVAAMLISIPFLIYRLARYLLSYVLITDRPDESDNW